MDNMSKVNSIKIKGIEFLNKKTNGKYELTDDTKTISDKNGSHIVHRIRALKDIGADVKAGDLGGYVESEHNLFPVNTCWIYEDAIVYGNAMILGGAQVKGNAIVCDKAKVSGNALIDDYATICGNAVVSDNAVVDGCAIVKEEALITNSAYITGKSIIEGFAHISGAARILDHARIMGESRVGGSARIMDYAVVKDYAYVGFDVQVVNDAIVGEENGFPSGAVVCVNTSKNLKENIRLQLGIIPFNDEIIVYKKVKKDLSSFYDSDFKYEVGKWIECANPSESNASCAEGLHFSNATYYDVSFSRPTESTYLIAKVRLKDIITVQRGKIRCRRAFILGTYNVGED